MYTEHDWDLYIIPAQAEARLSKNSFLFYQEEIARKRGKVFQHVPNIVSIENICHKNMLEIFYE